MPRQPARGHHKKKPKTPRHKNGKPYQPPPRLAGGLGKGKQNGVSNGSSKGGESTTVTKLKPRSERRKDLKEREIARLKKSGNFSDLLTTDDPEQLRKNLLLLKNALSKGYDVRNKGLMRKRAEEILRKQTGEVMTKHGIVESETKADELALDALRVLTKMDEIDLRRLEKLLDINRDEAKDNQGQSGTQVNINVNGNSEVTVNSDDKRSSLIMLARRFGASELVIDDQPVMEDGSNQEAIDVSGNEVES